MAVGKSFRERALSLLNRREHTRAELARKLDPHAEPDDDLNGLLDEFERRGWLSDERYARMRANARAGKYGNSRIAHELRDRGVAGDLIASTLSELEQSELARARAVWSSRFSVLPGDAKERARQARFLQGRGFGWEVIRAVLRGEER
jgi:regulatory protein